MTATGERFDVGAERRKLGAMGLADALAREFDVRAAPPRARDQALQQGREGSARMQGDALRDLTAQVDRGRARPGLQQP